MLGKTLLRDLINRSSETEADRRLFLRSAGLVGAGAAGAVGLGMAGAGAASAATPDDELTEDQKLSDATVLNFALNLEYLEAEFYLYAAYGHGLSNSDSDGNTAGGPKGGVKVRDGARVKFRNRAIRQYAEEIAQDEINHVRFLRGALGSAAIARPSLDLQTAFDGAAVAAGVADANGRFDPFASDLAFLLGAFIFEDVGVTAYMGGAALINSDTFLQAAGSILAVEAYHAGLVRSTLYGLGDGAIDAANKIAAARNSLNPGVDNDQGIRVDGQANLVPTDENSIVFVRSTQQVHNIAYLTPEAGVTSGGFFPAGTNNTNEALTTT